MGKYMKEEPSYELIGLESHGFLFIAIGIVPPAEGYIAVLELEDTVIADRYSMSVSAQILEDTLGAIERWLAIDNPFLMVKLASERLKGSGFLKTMNTTGEYKITRFKTAFEIVQELAPEQ
jgi:hypothetical protein